MNNWDRRCSQEDSLRIYKIPTTQQQQKWLRKLSRDTASFIKVSGFEATKCTVGRKLEIEMASKGMCDRWFDLISYPDLTRACTVPDRGRSGYEIRFDRKTNR